MHKNGDSHMLAKGCMPASTAADGYVNVRRLFTYVAVQVAFVTEHSAVVSAEAVSAHLNGQHTQDTEENHTCTRRRARSEEG